MYLKNAKVGEVLRLNCVSTSNFSNLTKRTEIQGIEIYLNYIGIITELMHQRFRTWCGMGAMGSTTMIT